MFNCITPPTNCQETSYLQALQADLGNSVNIYQLASHFYMNCVVVLLLLFFKGKFCFVCLI